MSKRALCLSGGGAHGSYQVGAIKALTENGISWDMVAGVSVGAINAAQVSMYKKENQHESVIELEKVWCEDIKGNSSVYKKHLPWFLNYFASLFTGGLHHTKPLMKILKARYDQKRTLDSGIELRIGTVALKSGKYIAITEKEVNAEWIMASSAMPIMFDPVSLGGERWVDGGIRNITPLNDVLVDPEVTEVDIVLADHFGDPLFEAKKFTSIIDVGERCLKLAVDEIFHTDIFYAFERGIKINLYFPKEIPNYESFDFNPAKLKEAIDKGYNETMTKLKSVP